MSNPRIRILPFGADRRGSDQRASYAAIEQERADLALLTEFRRRVAENMRRRKAASAAPDFQP